MNRRQVLMGAGATAIAVSGVAAWPSAANPDAATAASVAFPPFDAGIRGTYTLNGTVTLRGTVTPRVPGAARAAANDATSRVAAVQGPTTRAAEPVAAVPAAAATQYTAPVRAPVMSIVRVPRGSASRNVGATD